MTAGSEAAEYAQVAVTHRADVTFLGLEGSTLVSGAEIHTMRRGNRNAAAHYFRTILANDDRPHTMHAEAERTDGDLQPQMAWIRRSDRDGWPWC